MNVNISEYLLRVVILDISGIYVQIHNQGYFERDPVEKIKQRYSNSKLWRVLVLD